MALTEFTYLERHLGAAFLNKLGLGLVWGRFFGVCFFLNQATGSNSNIFNNIISTTYMSSTSNLGPNSECFKISLTDFRWFGVTL